VRFQVHRLAQDMNLLIQNRGVLFRLLIPTRDGGHRSRVTKYIASSTHNLRKYSRPRLGSSLRSACLRLLIPGSSPQNREVFFSPTGLIKLLAFFGCLSYFCLQVANKNMLRVFDSPTQDAQASCSSPQIHKRRTNLVRLLCICGDGGNRTPVQTMFWLESTMHRILLLV